MGKGVSVPKINERFMAMRPGGYLTGADEAFGEGLRGRGNEIITGGASQRLGRARSRLAQRGMLGGGLEMQAEADIGGAADAARATLGGEVGSIMHRLYDSNRQFEQGKVNTAWGAELQAKQRSDARRAAQRAAWWNSASRLIGSVLPMLGGGGGGGLPGSQMGEPGFEYPLLG
ncbi:MAG: hypothetical protein ACKVW3_01850 [Phycisphaerales bacterium]